jgi:hypothetical protein
MASKSDSPNMVAHPEKYVKIDVLFREGAACFKQASALPFSRGSLRVALVCKELKERILSYAVVNLRTACGSPL